MKLSIENFAKIKSANIKINGITVIAGKNNTGKSTIGEILACIFNSMYNIENTISDSRLSSLERLITMQILTSGSSRSAYRDWVLAISSARQNQQLDSILNSKTEAELKMKIRELFSNHIKNHPVEDTLLNELFAQIKKIWELSDEEIANRYVENYFSDVFNKFINNVHNTIPANVSVTVKEKTSSFEFKGNKLINRKCTFPITSRATFINNPFSVNIMNDESSRAANSLEYDLSEKLNRSASPEKADNTVVDQILQSEKQAEIEEKINSVIPGNILKHKLYYYTEGSKELDIRNISTGLKSFAIIKQLLLNSELIENDILILDEPEIHLHPEWQLAYAEILVMLQKQFELNIVITTHSSTFLESIDLYSQKHGIKNSCNYYLAEGSTDGTKFEDVTENLSEIYKQLVTPTIALTELREALENERE